MQLLIQYQYYRTYLDTLKNEYKAKIKDFASVDKMKELGEIDECEHRVLRGFIQRLDHNPSKPSSLDKMKVAQAYYDGMMHYSNQSALYQ